MKKLNMEVSYGVKTDWDKLDGWQQKAHPYTVTLKYDRKQMTLPFFMGPAHSREPQVEDVMACLASDYSLAVHTRNFNDFCEELGYDSDSRKAEQIYKQTVKQANKLEKLLGTDLNDVLGKYSDY